MAKYCNNCKAVRDSWADKGRSGTNYDIRCWSCDNYTLNSNAVSRPSDSDTRSMAKYAGDLVNSSPGNVEAKYSSESGIRYETNAVVEYSSHTFVFKKSK